MSAGRKNKGATLIEVMTALFIVVITTVTAATVITDTARSRLSQQEIMEGVNRLETVKKLLFCNYSYDEINEALKDNQVYFNSNIINNINSTEINILGQVQPQKNGYPCVKLQGSERQGGTMKIIISYVYEDGNVIENVFYKGNYEEKQ
ncbi:hypothetical protein [Clostridium culturomicium]|uniref:hypothetical protein n=1 Tax=Clostridium culturomicium TaxID=1499683 RepID=UPI0038575819